MKYSVKINKVNEKYNARIIGIEDYSGKIIELLQTINPLDRNELTNICELLDMHQVDVEDAFNLAGRGIA